jgi:hypothetical protein
MFVRSLTEKRFEFPMISWLIMGPEGGGKSLAGVNRSWSKVISRVGFLLLGALSIVLSWVLALRAFEWLLHRLGG